MTKKISLSEQDIGQIKQIVAGISINPPVLEGTFHNLIETLQSGHPLNRCIRNEQGNVCVFLGCADDSTLPGNVYLKYLASNKEIPLDLNEELQKLIKRARKFEYKQLSFYGGNPVLNRFLMQQGRVEQPRKLQTPAPFLVYTLVDTVETQVKEAIAYIELNAHVIIEGLNQTQFSNLEHALADAYRQHIDPRLHELYGALYTLYGVGSSLLEKPTSIAKIYKIAEQIKAQRIKEKKVTEYVQDLLNHLHITGEIHAILKSQISYILKITNKSKRNMVIKAALDNANISYDSTLLFNETFLYNLDPERDPLLICEYDLLGEPYQIVALLKMAHLEEETKQLGHCIGKSEFYIDKIRSEEIFAFSVRDTAGKSKYTLEYDRRTKNIKQFKGKSDRSINVLPDHKEIVTQTFDALTNAGYPILNCAESFTYALLYDTHKGRYFSKEDNELTTPYLSAHPHFQVIKGEIQLDEWTASEDIAYITTLSGVQIDATRLPQGLKSRITHVAGSLIDKSHVQALQDDGSVSAYPNLKSVGGTLDLKGTALPNLERVGGDVFIESHEDAFLAPKLKIVHGFLNIKGNIGECTLPALEKIGGYLRIGKAVICSLPELKSIGGDVNPGNVLELRMPKLEKIKGCFITGGLNNLELNSLKSIGDRVILGNSKKVAIAQLESVHGDFIANALSAFIAPKLQLVKGVLQVEEARNFSAPELQEAAKGISAITTRAFLAKNLKQTPEITISKGFLKEFDVSEELQQSDCIIIVHGIGSGREFKVFNNIPDFLKSDILPSKNLPHQIILSS